ncbi:TetR/AcrR family transcriptional regulator [Paenibacillus provencensis]|uniref:TetR/AcrR family transcriptional regulator n=1 Tax=Paenibacillus provencensis TaxID=441151 RepID=A0ABW3PJF4_9BACL|nr:TetR/AcrR family transcriptional regulator [Paenibacillus sp. MER 78]MCM3127082.1 TetR/AcrR family transcriptional regulator [Paenibacillus sp. MER 78]
MRDQNMDLRVIRTKESIREALVELMEDKGFEAVTVKDITTKARINRGTFYAHYQDKFDLMRKCQEEIMHELAQLAEEKFPDIVTEISKPTTPQLPLTIAVSIFECLHRNKRFMKAVLSPKGDLTFQTTLKEFMWNKIFGNPSNPLIKKENLLVPAPYLASYIASAHIGVIQQWLNSEGEESPDQMARILSTITINGPFYAAGLKK